jgi:hypothetical protein
MILRMLRNLLHIWPNKINVTTAKQENIKSQKGINENCLVIYKRQKTMEAKRNNKNEIARDQVWGHVF